MLNEMLPFFTKNYGNPSGLYMLSQESKAAIEFARDKVASVINSKASEIIFTSGGTESNNLALKGFCKSRIENDQDEIIIAGIDLNGFNIAKKISQEISKISEIDIK